MTLILSCISAKFNLGFQYASVFSFYFFFTVKSISTGETDVVDGEGQTKAFDLDSVPLALSCVDINQRDPKMEMKVVTNDPALIGEWFKIYVTLCNNEKDRVEDVSVIASLEEASDPLISDTTRLTLDYK